MKLGVKLILEAAAPYGFTAHTRTDGETTVVLTNYIDEPTDIEIDFEESFGGKTFYKYIYDPKTVEPKPGNEMIGCAGSVGEIDNKITDKLPGYAMVIYTTEKPWNFKKNMLYFL